jgi:hypothetical protein
MHLDVEAQTLFYFRPPIHYFWKWAEKGEVIEWEGGPTICFRDELMTILSGLASRDISIPSLGTLLLMLAACQDNWEGDLGGRDALREFVQNSLSSPDNGRRSHLEAIIRGMDTIHALPRELRSGNKKLHLVQEILRSADNPVPADQARLILAEFGTGRLDALIFRPVNASAVKQFQADSSRFVLAISGYRNEDQLQMKLKTGNSEVPKPAEVVLPEGDDLLEKLSEDPGTAGVARLAQRLLAVLHIPLHARGTGDQAFGGVSDITNRGNFDRLLLSELANDDMLLTARLVNQEALYLRREEPPAHPDRPRTVLIDTTLKMWGLPRVFALSAALACAQQKKHRAGFLAYALGGKEYRQIDINSQAGVVSALEQLDPSLACDQALKSFLHAAPTNRPSEIILIVAKEWAQEGRLASLSTGSRQTVRYLITVDRQGELQFMDWGQGNRKLLSTCRLDLQELLTATVKPARPIPNDPTLPAFIRQSKPPLYFPTIGINLKKRESYYTFNSEMVAITDNQRVLYCSGRNTGAMEMLPFIESGTYCFGSDGSGNFFITVHDTKKDLLKFYRLDMQEERVEEKDFSHQIKEVRSVIFKELFFWMSSANGYASIDCSTGKLTVNQKYDQRFSQIYQEQLSQNKFNPQLKKLINNGYTVLFRVNSIFVTDFGEFSLDHHRIRLTNNSIRISEDRKQMADTQYAKVEPDQPLPDNPNVRMSKARWSNGSTAVLDSRGFVHLRSANPSIPEITLVLVIGKQIAGWAADGNRFGPSYFTGLESNQFMCAKDFYTKYIQRYIDQLS